MKRLAILVIFALRDICWLSLYVALLMMQSIVHFLSDICVCCFVFFRNTVIVFQVNSSLAFYLFSFQVHEKSILLVTL